jgi:DNA uptake protein ComE-like DNA-binding protein
MKTSPLRHRSMSRRSVAGKRQAFLLLAVLLVISAVTLAALAFMQSMLLGHEESRLTGESIQARYAADSGIDAARLFVAYNRAARLEAGGTFSNPNTFQAIPVLEGRDPLNPCNYSLIAPDLNEDGSYSSIRFGLQNESARLNLNVLPMIDSALSVPAALMSAASSSLMPTTGAPSGSSDASGSGDAGGMGASGSIGRDLLMALPAMTEEIADAILDFIDTDNEPREFGCESEYYAQLPSPYAPMNGPLHSIEQLLLVRGVTPYLLFGLDQNRNGVLESSESNAALTGTGPPGSGLDGTVAANSNPTGETPPSLGWAMYLTLYSKEKNISTDGQTRINLNGPDLNQLRTDLASTLGDELATFIIAYRVLGSGGGGGGGLGGAAGVGGAGIPDGGGIPGGGGAPGGGRRQGGGGGAPGGGRGQGGGGGAPGGGRGQGGGGRGGGGGGAPRGGRSELAWMPLASPLFSLVSMPQPPAGGGGGAGAGGGGRGNGGQGGGPGRGDGGGRGNGADGGMGNPGAGGVGGIGGGGGQSQGERRPWSANAFESLNIDMDQNPQGRVNGVLELIDSSFTASVNGQDVTFQSPLTSSPVQMALYLPMLMDKVTTVDATMLPGRININEAPREILSGLPGMSSDILDKLVESRAQSADTENRKFETWPMLEGIITLQQMKTIAPLITAGGDVMRVQSVGYFEQSAGYARTEAVIDGSGAVPIIVLYRKLDHLGRGFSQSTLGQRAAGMGTGMVPTP